MRVGGMVKKNSIIMMKKTFSLLLQILKMKY